MNLEHGGVVEGFLKYSEKKMGPGKRTQEAREKHTVGRTVMEVTSHCLTGSGPHTGGDLRLRR